MDNFEGIVAAVSVSVRRGMRKQNVESAELKAGMGVAVDSHAGPGDKQVSLCPKSLLIK